ncbi:lamin tail domain-containing protein [Stieleria sp. JC731]|uniref:lamin tail domain-containing protein n=1 Tax=Pirellulaceae TaxID=2691357 RepID=UPI001E6532E3|nr:lamin tail domain-containing protein [Stieleria sp. JC731]MCC9600665.1 lamin tail domain-containing protein [Stieleria sp. JC731]
MLEERICLSAVRIVSWNTANAPNNSTEDTYFSTVFEAIGNENVVGNAIAPSIIALQETDNAQLGGNSIARIDSLLETLYPQTVYDHAVTGLDTGGDATGFVYDTAIFELVSTAVVAETGGMRDFAHDIMRGQFRPVGTSGQSDFYIYTTHLKAGSSGDNISRRTAEANAIRLDIDSLGANQDVLVMGDFNISGSSEGAYQNFLRSGTGQLFDPIDSPGEWKNNVSFRAIHTQNPAINGAGGMDDRFDFQLASGAVFDNEGLQFIEGSYRAFGNNGTHTFNSDITTGSGATPNVLAALAAASDHLPVVVDYEIDVNLPGINLDTGGSPIQIVEGSSAANYNVHLDTVPSSSVTVTITSDAKTLVNGSSQAVLTFTTENALVPQTVSIQAIDDTVANGNQISVINHAIDSEDADYDSLDDVPLNVTVIDNDLPSIAITEIMYNPASSEPLGEWVEIANLGPGVIDISGWTLDDEDDTNWATIPTVSPLAEGSVAILHNSEVDSNTFRDRWAIDSEVTVIGIDWGSLANGPSQSSEILQLIDSFGEVQDEVNYDDENDWPVDDNGSSIYLMNPRLDNNVGSYWGLTDESTPEARHPSGSPFSSADIGTPGFVPGLVIDPPRIVETRLASEIANVDQRSVLRSVTVVFDRIVAADASAFELIRQGSSGLDAAKVGIVVSAADVLDHTEITLRFAGQHADLSGSLVDGAYELHVMASGISSGGITLDGDGDGNSGGDYRFGESSNDRFFRLFGDYDGDKDVDRIDMAVIGDFLRKNEYEAAFDADDDEDVDLADFAQFRVRLSRR